MRRISAAFGALTSRADDGVHRVTYTVTADQSLNVDIYYREAMIAVSRVSTQPDGMIRCELAVDGVVVDIVDGSTGAVCSLRHW